MNKKNLSISITLLIFGWTGSLYAEEIVSINPQDSLVMMISSTPLGKRAGNGFVIGDGTLVVTAHHLVFEDSKQGQHEMAGLVTLFSPYLGEGCDVEIIAADKGLDLAILKVAWPGHPALKLADDKSIISAEKMEIISIPEIIRNMSPDANSPLPQRIDVQVEKLGVDFVAVSQHIPRFISLSGTGQIGDGWSGSPMLLPGTSEVAGCFVQLHHTTGQSTKTSQGPAMSQIRNLLDKAGELKSLDAAKSVISKPKDGEEVFLRFLQAYRHFTDHKYELALEETQALIHMRSESAFAYELAANTNEILGKYNMTEQYYQKALKLNPKSISLTVLYAQFRSEREPDKALEMLNNIWMSEETKPVVALLMFNILSERGDFQRSCDLLNEAIKVSPNNAYLWVNLGACQLQLDKIDDAITSITKAVELMPERGLFRGQLAHLLEKNGKLDEAEKHFRELISIEPDNPVVHMWLAKFLDNHRPSSKGEAIKEAEIALGFPARKGLSTQEIEQFIRNLKCESSEEAVKESN